MYCILFLGMLRICKHIFGEGKGKSTTFESHATDKILDPNIQDS